jgi:diaminohydroxyphosphoribosylaminopyrimidine deaminase / 5-amino-6-(5-phosphoribosylamino)uracil reductase
MLGYQLGTVRSGCRQFRSMRAPPKTHETADLRELETRAWGSLRAAAAALRQGKRFEDPWGWLATDGGELVVAPGTPVAVRPLLELYAPLCTGRLSTLAHLGQSLDGCIATGTGDSYYVTGPDNVRHLHRLRALSDVIVVGAGTVASDNPQLTVRKVEGPNPVRVVLDPSARLDPRRRVFTDGAAPTLVVHAEGLGAPQPGNAEILAAPVEAGRLRLDVLLERLHARGWLTVFVEGGGTTVSRFLEAGLLDRLHIAIAPLVTGRGRQGLSLPARERLADCLRPAHRVFTMGGDVLFDCDLRAAAVAPPSGTLTRAI